MAEWYWMKDGQKHGPVDTAHLRQLARAGQLQPTDIIWRDGLPNWVEASRAKGLFSQEVAAAPLDDRTATPPSARRTSEEPPRSPSLEHLAAAQRERKAAGPAVLHVTVGPCWLGSMNADYGALELDGQRIEGPAKSGFTCQFEVQPGQHVLRTEAAGQLSGKYKIVLPSPGAYHVKLGTSHMAGMRGAKSLKVVRMRPGTSAPGPTASSAPSSMEALGKLIGGLVVVGVCVWMFTAFDSLFSCEPSDDEPVDRSACTQIDLEAIHSDVISNRSRASDRWEGRLVYADGVVRDPGGRSFECDPVGMEGRGWGITIQCTTAKVDGAKSLSALDSVRVYGRIISVMEHYVYLENCIYDKR